MKIYSCCDVNSWRNRYEAEGTAKYRSITVHSGPEPVKDGRTVILIHGFNTDPEGMYGNYGAWQAGNLDVRCVGFQWPSNGIAGLMNYYCDVRDARWAAPILARLIMDLYLARAQSVSIVAHSMGAWLTLEALSYLAKLNDGMYSRPGSPKFVASVALCGADIQVRKVANYTAGLAMANRVRAYYSEEDHVLGLASKIVRPGVRVGKIGSLFMESVNAELIAGEPVHHRTYFRNEKLVKDIMSYVE